MTAFVDVRLKYFFYFQRVKTCLKLFQYYFADLLQLLIIWIFSNMFIVAEIILK